MARRPRLIVPPALDDGPADLAQLALALKDRVDILEGWSAQLARQDAQTVEGVMADAYSVGWRSDPALMAHHLTKGEYKLWPYVRYLSAKLREAVEGKGARLIVNMPARFGKSLLFGGWGLVWVFDRRPEARIIIASYGDDLANEDAIFVRDRLREHRDELRTQLRVDRQKMDRFVTQQGGGLLAAGINSAITGFGCGHGGGLLIDDPFKGWQDAHSAHGRDHVWNQYRSVLRRRLDDPDAWIIVVHTRWHEDDLTGRLVKQSEDETGMAWDVVRIPALAEANDPLGRALGDVIEEERFPKHIVLDAHREMGSYLASAMEQQKPAPEEGTELKRAWWRVDDVVPERFDDALTSWDMKLKEKEAGDWCVGELWTRVGSQFWFLDAISGQWNQVETRVAMCLMKVRYPWVEKHVIENAGYGPEVYTELRRPQPGWTCSDEMAARVGVAVDERAAVEKQMRRGMSGLLKETPKGSKPVRMRAYSGRIEAGDVHLDGRRAWVPHFLDQASAFPNGSHDDWIDACSQALKRLSNSAATVSAPKAALPRKATSTAKGRALTSRRSLVQGARRPGSQGLRPRPR